MKRSPHFSFLLAGVIAVLPVTGTFAQDPAAAPTPSVSAPAQGPDSNAGQGTRKGGKNAMLTSDERKELRAAHEKALSDPAVQAVDKSDKKAYHKAVREAMIKADPNVESILAKRRANKVQKKDLQAS